MEDFVKSTWIEVALNGGGPRHLQPLIPMTEAKLIEEGVACARAGASIIHLHVRDPETEEQVDDFDAYRRVFEGIREQVDAIVYPTIPLKGPPAARQRTCRRLAEQGLLEWVVIDPASVLFISRSGAEAGESGWVYENTGDHARCGLKLAEEFGLTPTFSIYEPGFLRAARAFSAPYDGLELESAVYRLMLSDELLFGPCPTAAALIEYHQQLKAVAPESQWMVGGLLFDPTELMPLIVELGGHLRVGLEDAPAHSESSNVQWVEKAARVASRAGRVATPTDVRACLKVRK